MSGKEYGQDQHSGEKCDNGLVLETDQTDWLGEHMRRSENVYDKCHLCKRLVSEV